MIKRSINFILKTLANIIIILLVFYLALTAIFPTKVVDIIGFKTYVVLTTSMVPEIKTTDMIILTKTDKTTLNRGDIISFNAYGKYKGEFVAVVVTHYVGERIINENGDVYYKTQGYEGFHADDYLDKYDEWYDQNGTKLQGIEPKDVIGKYSLKIPYIGFIVKFIQDVSRYPLLLILICINILIFWFLFYYISNTKTDNYQYSTKKKKTKKITKNKVKINY